MIMVLEERFQKSLQIVNDKLGNYPRPKEPAWTRIERHKDGYLMPWRLHVKDETVGASIKAKLNRPETLPNEPSSHQLRRTTTSKKSLFIGPTKSQTRYIHTNHFTLITEFPLLWALFADFIIRDFVVGTTLVTTWEDPHSFTNLAGIWTNLYWKPSGRTQPLTVSVSSVWRRLWGWEIQTFVWNCSLDWFRHPNGVQYPTKFCSISFANSDTYS